MFLPAKQKASSSKWVFKVNYHLDSSIERYKGRLVAQSFSQVYRINYTKTFVPAIKQQSLKIFLAITTMLGMILLQMNVIGAYLESLLRQDECHSI